MRQRWLSQTRELPIGSSGLWNRNAFDHRSNQTQQLHVLRAIASLTKECVNFDVCRVSAGGLIRNVSDENASRFGFTSEQPSIAGWAVVELSISRTMNHLWLKALWCVAANGNFPPGASSNLQA